MTHEHRLDVLGRSWSTGIDCWLGGQPIPVGARVRVLPDRHSVFHRHCVGLEAVVLRRIEARRPLDEVELKCRFVVPQDPWGTMNHGVLRERCVDVVQLGDGQALPDRDYTRTPLELAQERFAATDLHYQDYSNAPTFLAALYLRADALHHRNVLAMVRCDGRINPTRLANYFARSGLTIDDWAHYPPGFPERSEFRLEVNWVEVAQEFEELARECAASA